MSVAIDKPPQPGEIVRVRSRRYLVEAVELAPRPEDQTLVRLSCLEDDAEGEELEVLWEKEVDAQLVSEADWSRLAQGHFDLPRHFAAYYRTLRWNTVTSTDSKLFQDTYGAAVVVPALTVALATESGLLQKNNATSRHGSFQMLGLAIMVMRFSRLLPPGQIEHQSSCQMGLQLAFDRPLSKRMRIAPGPGASRLRAGDSSHGLDVHSATKPAQASNGRSRNGFPPAARSTRKWRSSVHRSSNVL